MMNKLLLLILPALVFGACRATPEVVLPTPAALPATPTATRTPVETHPPALTETLLPTSTATSALAATNAAAADASGTCPPHENEWHAPADEPCQHHHHGVNPREYTEIFSIDGFDLDRFLDDYGELRQLWETSATEEWNGYIWLYEHVPDCEQYTPESGSEMWADWDCITDVLVRIHDTGTADHFLKRFHSETFIIKGCAKDADGLPDFANCGVIATGDHHDYGEMHAPYKKVHCPVLDMDPLGFHELDQPPYRAHTILDPLKPTPYKVVQFWSGQPPNPINNPGNAYYPHEPNHLVGFGWSSVDAWQLFDPSVCGGTYAEMAAAAANFPVVAGMEHVTFQIWNLRVFAHPAGPFSGWTDQNGHIWPPGVCETASPSCIPLIVTEHFPVRNLILQRRVDQANCAVAPCLVIDTGGVEMLFPGDDLP